MFAAKRTLGNAKESELAEITSEMQNYLMFPSEERQWLIRKHTR